MTVLIRSAPHLAAALCSAMTIAAVTIAALTIAAVTIAFPQAALSQAYPSKPVHMVVPFAAGGGTDNIARNFAQKFSELWKQQVIVENRAGAGGNIGADAVAKAAPDGYTLLFTPNGLAVSPSLYRKLPFDAIKDFAPVTQVAFSYLALTVSPKLPAASVQELIALAKAQPGKLNFGSSGVGAPSHLMGEMLKSSAAIDIVHIPYKGDAQSIPALLAGEIHMVFIPLSVAMPQLKAGRVRSLAVVGLKRSRSAPDVPTMIEAGLPDFQVSIWQGIFAPAGTPNDILAKISGDTARILRMPDFAERLPTWGLEPSGSSPQEFAAVYKSDIEKYARIIRQANIQPLE